MLNLLVNNSPRGWPLCFTNESLKNCFKILMNFHFFPFFFSGNIDSNKSSITNGICCSTNTKYTKPGRKNSNHSQQDFDKKPLNNNNSEHFDGIDQIIANVNTGTLKSKKSGQSKSKDRQKLHGSLPNHLDTDVDYEGSDDTNSSGKLIVTISNFPSFGFHSIDN